MGLQFGFAFLVLKTDLGLAFKTASDGVNNLLAYASEGSKFVSVLNNGSKRRMSSPFSPLTCEIWANVRAPYHVQTSG